MEKLIEGVIKFQNEIGQTQLQDFAKLASKQNPQALFITCYDSRVVPSLFTSSKPGDLFVLRNVGNIIPPAKVSNETSEVAALSIAIEELNIKDIIICGHSDCLAMKILSSKKSLSPWIKYALPSKNSFKQNRQNFSSDLSDENVLSQINVLQQIDHLKTYQFIQKKIDSGQLKLHAWWFDIATAS